MKAEASQWSDAGRAPEAQEPQNRLFPRALGGGAALLTPRFQISGPQNCERIDFCCFKS